MRGLDVLHRGDAKHRGSADPGEDRRIDDTDGNHHVRQAGTKHRDDGNGEQHIGKGKDHIHDAHQQVINPPAAIARGNPHHQPNHRGNTHGDKADLQRGRRAVNDTGEHITTKLIRAEQVRRGGGLILGQDILSIGIVGSNHRRRRRP